MKEKANKQLKSGSGSGALALGPAVLSSCGGSDFNSLSWFCHVPHGGDNGTYLIEMLLGRCKGFGTGSSTQ